MSWIDCMCLWVIQSFFKFGQLLINSFAFSFVGLKLFGLFEFLQLFYFGLYVLEGKMNSLDHDLQLYNIRQVLLMGDNSPQSIQPSQSNQSVKSQRVMFYNCSTTSKNLMLLREVEQNKIGEQGRQNKSYFETSLITLGVSLGALAVLNVFRGAASSEHEFRHRWSRPLWLLLNGVALVNISATVIFGCRYSQELEKIQGIKDLAADPRVFLDIDRLHKNMHQDGQILIEKGSLREYYKGNS